MGKINHMSSVWYASFNQGITDQKWGIGVTKKELEQLIDLKKEIKELEQSILKIQQMYIGDAPVTVDASKKNFPYIQGKAIVHGYNPVLAKKRSEHLCEKKMLLDDRRKKAAKE